APPLRSLIEDPTWVGSARSTNLQAFAELPPPHARPLQARGDTLSGPAGTAGTTGTTGSKGSAGTTAPTGSAGSAGALVLLSQQLDGRWRLITSAGKAVDGQRAFGWATGFTLPAGTVAFAVTPTGQAARSAQTVVLSLLWLSALWITRRPSRPARG